MRALRAMFHRTLPCLALLSLLALAACSGEPGKSPASPAKAAQPSAAASAAPAEAPALAASLHQSKFSTSPDLRDPFFPKKRPVAATAASTTKVSAGPADLAALLQAGFQGTIGSGAQRLGLLNNVILETGRTVSIPVIAPGQRFEVTARVRQVLPNSVVLDVENPRQTVTVTRTQK